MAGKSKIEWCTDSWNPIVGCSVVSPGCTNCYAMKFSGTRLDGNLRTPHYAGLTHPSTAGPVWTGKVALASDETLTAPLRWRQPRKIFVNSMGDLFHESIPDEWIDRVFAVMALAPQHTFQVLTKRSARMREYMSDMSTTRRIAGVILEAGPEWRQSGGAMLAPLGERANEADPSFVRWPLPNVWAGVSAEDQRRADERIPDLLATPAVVRFVSAEPLLGQIDFSRWTARPRQVCNHRPGEIFFDDQMRIESLQDREHIARACDLPPSDRFPALSRGTRGIPPNEATEALQPIHDLRCGAINCVPRRVGSSTPSSPVEVSLPVEQAGEIADRGRIGRDHDCFGKPARADKPEIDALALQSSPDVRSMQTDNGADFGKGFPVSVEGGKFLIHGNKSTIDWVIAGGESGPRARECAKAQREAAEYAEQTVAKMQKRVKSLTDPSTGALHE